MIVFPCMNIVQSNEFFVLRITFHSFPLESFNLSAYYLNITTHLVNTVCANKIAARLRHCFPPVDYKTLEYRTTKNMVPKLVSLGIILLGLNQSFQMNTRLTNICKSCFILNASSCSLTNTVSSKQKCVVVRQAETNSVLNNVWNICVRTFCCF